MVHKATQQVRVPAGESDPRPDRPVQTPAMMRLDPYRLPHKVTSETQDGFSYAVDRHGAAVKRRLPCGLKLSIALPSLAFRGVAARSMEHGDGSYTVSLELLHHDRDLSLPLLVAHDLDDIAADWHAWSRMMRLPMLIVGPDEVARPVSQQLGQVMVDMPLPRRKRFGSLKHRPNFLRRRKPGTIGPVVKVTGEELIARR
ncbi:MAG: DUF6101 family protein [Pseudomonadota bacterium]|nr:DUF6101 family protein [Pseudomonadota bacterium]